RNPAMSSNAPRSIDDYLKQLRAALEGEDPALIQDALYDAEEYLRAEVAAHPDKSEADVLELIASTYGAPDEVAAAYRDTEVKVKAALKTPAPAAAEHVSGAQRVFGVFLDPRAYLSLFSMLLTLATGIAYFVIATLGLSVGLKLAAAPFVLIAERLGWLGEDFSWFEFHWHHHWGHHWTGFSTGSLIGSLFMLMVGVVVLTVLMHAARGIARAHVRLAKVLLVEPGA